MLWAYYWLIKAFEGFFKTKIFIDEYARKQCYGEISWNSILNQRSNLSFWQILNTLQKNSVRMLIKNMAWNGFCSGHIIQWVMSQPNHYGTAMQSFNYAVPRLMRCIGPYYAQFVARTQAGPGPRIQITRRIMIPYR